MPQPAGQDKWETGSAVSRCSHVTVEATEREEGTWAVPRTPYARKRCPGCHVCTKTQVKARLITAPREWPGGGQALYPCPSWTAWISEVHTRRKAAHPAQASGKGSSRLQRARAGPDSLPQTDGRSRMLVSGVERAKAMAGFIAHPPKSGTGILSLLSNSILPPINKQTNKRTGNR